MKHGIGEGAAYGPMSNDVRKREMSYGASTTGLMVTATREQALKAARQLLALYPAWPASDQKVFTACCTQLFMTCTADELARVLSPISGIAAKFKFAPSLAEIKQTVEAWREEDHRSATRGRPLRGNTARRAREEPTRLPTTEERQRHLAQLRAIHGPSFGLGKFAEEMADRAAAHLKQVEAGNARFRRQQ